MTVPDVLDGTDVREPPLRYRERLAAALAELEAKGVSGLQARPVAFRALRLLGLPVPPPLYLGLIGATLYHALLVVPLIGVCLWWLIWRHDALAPLDVVPTVLQVGLLPAFGMALLTRWRAWRLGRTPWQALNGLATRTGS